MSVELSRRLFSVDEYHRMLDAGVFESDDRLELLHGGIIEISPIGSRHAACVNKLNAILSRLPSERGIVAIQNPVVVDERSELQPDVCLLRSRDDYYASDHPRAEDVELIIEVADASLDYDRQCKIPLYAEAGVPEVWLIDLRRGTVDRFSDVLGGQYARVETYHGNDAVPTRVLGSIALRVSDILP
ncbi:MAG: Uma2 family endonuclease [Planctomycetes bacterium]|nr:Uma2 family endonuclease [Planctomycetota bacterium]